MNAANRNIPLTPEERQAMLAVLDNYQPHELITTALHFLDIHLPRKYLLPALRWLKKNRLTGKALADFICLDCEMRFLVFQRKLLIALYKDKGVELVAGRTVNL